jgi:hypothetical protein
MFHRAWVVILTDFKSMANFRTGKSKERAKTIQLEKSLMRRAAKQFICFAS